MRKISSLRFRPRASGIHYCRRHVGRYMCNRPDRPFLGRKDPAEDTRIMTAVLKHIRQGGTGPVEIASLPVTWWDHPVPVELARLKAAILRKPVATCRELAAAAAVSPERVRIYMRHRPLRPWIELHVRRGLEPVYVLRRVPRPFRPRSRVPRWLRSRLESWRFRQGRL